LRVIAALWHAASDSGEAPSEVHEAMSQPAWKAALIGSRLLLRRLSFDMASGLTEDVRQAGHEGEPRLIAGLPVVRQTRREGMKNPLRWPSPATVISIVALIVALGGTAIAGGVLNKKKVKTIAANVANGEITKRAPGLSVASAKDADKLGGQPASFYAPATTLRTGLINANGTVDAAHSDGVTSGNVTSPAAGIYCFNGLSPAPRSMVASIAGGTAGIQTQVAYAPAGLCTGSQFSVGTFTDANAAVADAFTVFIH
jgi:hypothetical protein